MGREGRGEGEEGGRRVRRVGEEGGRGEGDLEGGVEGREGEEEEGGRRKRGRE